MLDKINILLKNGESSPTLSKFLTLDEQIKFKSDLVKIEFCNNYHDEERKRALIYPKDLQLSPNFKIALLEIIGKGDFGHRDILGSIIGLGITRDVIGDIIITNDKKYIIVAEEIAKYIIDNLMIIRKSRVEVKECSLDLIKNVNTNNYIEEEIIVSSMRLDAIISRILHLSREKAKEYIIEGYVKVNNEIKQNVDYQCKLNDRLSLIKKGRAIIKNIKKITKKDKIVLLIEKTK